LNKTDPGQGDGLGKDMLTGITDVEIELVGVAGVVATDLVFSVELAKYQRGRVGS